MNLTLGLAFQTSSATAREWLNLALQNDITPVPQPSVPSHRVSLYLPASIHAQLASAAQKSGATLGHEAENRIYAVYLQQRAAPAPSAGGSAATAPTATPPKAHDPLDALRNRLYHSTLQGLNLGKVVFAEASTGIGKSRVLGRIADNLLKLENGKASRVVVSAPTVAVVAHLLREFRALSLHPAVLLGRRQFLATEAARAGIETILTAPDTTPEIKQECEALTTWINDGGPAITETSKTFAAETPIAYLADDAASLAPSLPITDWTLRGDDTTEIEPGAEGYHTLRGHATDAPLALQTHAMTALQILRESFFRGDSAETDTYLLVDEAHELEDYVAKSLGADLSVMSLIWWLKREYTGKKVGVLLEESTQLLHFAQNCGARNEVRLDLIHAEEIKRLCRNLAKHLKGEKSPEGVEFREILNSIAADAAALMVSFSRIHRFPSIIKGPPAIGQYLDKRLWKPLRAAALLSATLYLPGKHGEPTAFYSRLKLGVPGDRAATFDPVIAPEILNTPTVHAPDLESAKTLSYPGSDEQTEAGSASSPELAKWYAAVAASILLATENAEGGTLVLCNSHSDARALRKLTQENLGDRLLDRGGTIATGQTTARFKLTARARQRPVWIATGGAWTGLDLRDDRATSGAEDTVLTDLVIVRLPYGLSRSSTHLGRKEWMGFSPEIHETMMRFKQGLGRLVRRSGLLHRRLWVLDGRIITLPKPHYSIFRRMIRDYPKQTTFTL